MAGLLAHQLQEVLNTDRLSLIDARAMNLIGPQTQGVMLCKTAMVKARARMMGELPQLDWG